MRRLSWATALFASSPAFALRGAGPALELASGDEARPGVTITERTSRPEWDAFLSSTGGEWRAIWDADHGTPVRIWGSGLDARGSVSDEATAERAARSFLARNAALLAPGTSASDFELAANDLTFGVRTVAFRQTRGGVPVAGGQVSFRFKRDRLIAIASEAIPNLDVRTTGSVSRSEAIRAASTWMAASFDRFRVETTLDPIIRAITLEDGRVHAAHVLPVVIRTEHPIGRYEVDVDLETGRPFARRQTLLFAAGELRYDVPVRHPRGVRVDAPAQRANLTVDGAAAVTDDAGAFTWTSTQPVGVVATASGPLVNVINGGGESAAASFTFEDGQSMVWSASTDEFTDAQLNAFVAARKARDYVAGIAPNLRFLAARLDATVNIDDRCNAFSDGTTINFFRAGDGCENTGRLADVVMHEYGHSVHAHSIILGAGDFDSALSEGASDYLAATIQDDPAMGRGFFFTEEPLRHVDPEGSEAVWPYDQGEPHVTGLIFAGAMWDLRKVLIEGQGREAGIAAADRLWFGVLQRASSIQASYVEVLVGDDDDGDLSNGTPNLCAITDAFRAHGLAKSAEAGLEIGRVEIAGGKVSIAAVDRGLCPGFAITRTTMTWDLRGRAGIGEAIPMTRAGDVLEATIPPQPEGEVLRYRVEIELANGEILAFPDNPADPSYEMFIGEVVPIYCTDFESDPMAEGWTHEMISGTGRRARDEWEWGPPNPEATGSGDPATAYSGDNVMGNDLGIESFGTYQRNKIEELRSPPIEAAGFAAVRLHYRRWLTIEDGAFDHAEILAGDSQLWSNAASADGELHHVDREWRFHDVDLTGVAAAGPIQVTYRLTSDDGFQLGGWTIDDFCIVGWTGPSIVCGDGELEGMESCDDGNTAGGDGCEADCTPTPAICGNGRVDPGEACDDGNSSPGDGCEASCVPSPMVEPPITLIDDESGCGCAAHEGTSLGWTLLVLPLLALRRRTR
jgi:cysteine-rich repeat protein